MRTPVIHVVGNGRRRFNAIISISHIHRQGQTSKPLIATIPSKPSGSPHKYQVAIEPPRPRSFDPDLIRMDPVVIEIVNIKARRFFRPRLLFFRSIEERGWSCR